MGRQAHGRAPMAQLPQTTWKSHEEGGMAGDGLVWPSRAAPGWHWRWPPRCLVTLALKNPAEVMDDLVLVLTERGKAAEREMTWGARDVNTFPRLLKAKPPGPSARGGGRKHWPKATQHLGCVWLKDTGLFARVTELASLMGTAVYF